MNANSLKASCSGFKENFGYLKYSFKCGKIFFHGASHQKARFDVVADHFCLLKGLERQEIS